MKERKKEDQRNSPLFFFFEVRIFRVSNSTKKKNLESPLWGGGDKDTQKKGRFSSFAWLACVDASKNKAQNDPFVGLSKKNQREHTKKKKQHLHKFGGGQRHHPRVVGVFTRRLVFRGDGEFARDTILEEASRYEF